MLGLLLPLLGQANIIDVFGLQHNPARGEFVLRKGTVTQKILFGRESSLYGLGFRVTPDILPEPYRSQFTGQSVILSVFGNASPGEKTAQFGTLIFFHEPFKKSLKLRVPSKYKRGEKNALYVQLRSPLAGVSDEEMLKETLFGTGGGATISLTGLNEGAAVAFNDKRLRFTKSRLKIELNLLLATPFSAESGDVRGVVELPIFSPGAADTKSFLKEVIAEVLKAPVSLPADRTVGGW